MEDKIYHNLKNTTVRNLYWLLFSNSPLSQSYDISPYIQFPNQILEEWKLLSQNYFIELDKNPSSLITFLDRKKNKRLGFYAEALLSYFFQTFNQIELLLQNFQIINKHKTVGEIDFIILYNKKVIHLECAVKYYLLKDFNNANEPSNWVGPRMKDNLKLKLLRLINHQLPLGTRKEISDKINCNIDSSYLFVKGIFFAEKELYSNIVSTGKPNQFIRQSELDKLAVKPIKVLIRPNWLSSNSPSKLNSATDFIQLDQPMKKPELVLFEDNRSRFIVPDNWGKE
ncbi:MAG TPA: DUF1853 family protein [Brumimicrobium sp.]|nr:DUF1853 family protein [Brumimicrobium sp.]